MCTHERNERARDEVFAHRMRAHKNVYAFQASDSYVNRLSVFFLSFFSLPDHSQAISSKSIAGIVSSWLTVIFQTHSLFPSKKCFFLLFVDETLKKINTMFVEFEATDIENMQPDKLNKRASERVSENR